MVVFLDSDLVDIGPEFVVSLLGPLLTVDGVELVKGFYHRPLRPRREADATLTGGGRVTELTARPVWPPCARSSPASSSPSAGSTPPPASCWSRCPSPAGYGVEIGLLLDTHRTRGLDAIGQVDLGVRKHRHRSLRALGATAAEVLDAALRRCVPGHPGADPLVQFVPVDGDWLPDEQAVAAVDRPPLAHPAAHGDLTALGRQPPSAVGAGLRSEAMGSALVYVVVVGLVAAAVYLVAALVFGRGEELAPMPPGATPTRLPARDLTGGDVRDLRFQQALRGYKCSEVDWALERLAAEVDALRARVAVMEGRAGSARRPSATTRRSTGRRDPRRRPATADAAGGVDRSRAGNARAGRAPRQKVRTPPWRAARSRCRSTSTPRSRRCGRS